MNLSTELLPWGLQMTVIGMSLVFAMLALLWLLLTIVLKLDTEEEEEPEKAAEPASTQAEASPPAETAAEPAAPARPMIDGMEAELVAAILTAAHKHRQALRLQAAPIVCAATGENGLWTASGRARQTQHWQPKGR